MILFNALWAAVTFMVSMILNPHAYRPDASLWASRRAAPAVGTVLALVAIYGNLQLLRRKNKSSALYDLLAILISFCTVGSAVTVADFARIFEADVAEMAE